MLSIILPAYNEADKIEVAVKRVAEFAGEIDEFEIIIAEDGSTDGTDLIAKELANRYDFVKHLHSDEREGRGKALKRAFKLAEGDVIIYMDVDLSTDLSHLREFVKAIKDGYGIAIASRFLKDSKVERSFLRSLLSRVYNILVRFLLSSNVRDHQCGFKAFNRDVILDLVEDVRDDHWFFDTELLILAQRKGIRIKEIPVRWRESGSSKVSSLRDSIYMFWKVLELSRIDGNRFLFLTISIAIAIYLMLILYSGIGNLYNSFFKLNTSLIILAFFIYLLSYPIRGIRYVFLLKKVKRNLNLPLSTGGIAISQSVNVVTPIRIGDLARAYVFKKYGIEYAKSLSALTAERIYDLIAIIGLAILSSSILMKGFGKEITYATFLLLTLIIGVIILSKQSNIIGGILKDAKNIIFSSEFPLLFILSILIWLIDILTCYLIFMSFGNDFMIVAFGVTIGNIAKMIPITPGGIGSYEAVLGLILSTKYDISNSLAVAIVDHAIKNIATVFLGFISAIKFNISLKELKE